MPNADKEKGRIFSGQEIAGSSIALRPSPLSNSEIPERHVVGGATSHLPNGETVHFTKVRDGLIVGPSDALVFLGEGKEAICCVDSSLLPNVAPITFLPRVLSCPGMMEESEERVIEDPVLFLAGQGSRAPFHWPHDALTRLLAFERIGEDARILVPVHQATSRFITESLELLGIPDERLEYVHPNERIRARELWISEDLDPHEGKLNTLLAMLRTRMLEAAGCDPNLKLSRGEGQSVYISRQSTPDKRGIENAHEFSELAARFGFIERRMEMLTLKEQIQVAAQTTRVLAPHGAGLFNTLYMPGGEVIELFSINEAGVDTNKPCWGRLLDVHAAQGRTVSWRAIESSIIRKTDTRERDADWSIFTIVADLAKIEAELRAPSAEKMNEWIRVRSQSS